MWTLEIFTKNRIWSLKKGIWNTCYLHINHLEKNIYWSLGLGQLHDGNWVFTEAMCNTKHKIEIHRHLHDNSSIVQCTREHNGKECESVSPFYAVARNQSTPIY